MTRLIVVPPDGEPERELAPPTNTRRAVRPSEPAWSDGYDVVHVAITDEQSTGCGKPIPYLGAIRPAYQFPRPRLCSAIECFGVRDDD